MRRERKDAFTLIEMLVVILIIGLLAGIVLGTMGLARAKAKQSRAVADIQLLANVLEEYRMEYGRYPAPESDDWVDLTMEVFGNDISEAMEGKLEGLKCYDSSSDSFADPWQNAYRYRFNSRFSYELHSVGPDGDESAAADNISTSDI